MTLDYYGFGLSDIQITVSNPNIATLQGENRNYSLNITSNEIPYTGDVGYRLVINVYASRIVDNVTVEYSQEIVVYVMEYVFNYQYVEGVNEDLVRGMQDGVISTAVGNAYTLAFDIWDFMENEHAYAEEYPEIYATIPEKRTPQPRGKNTLIDCFSRIRTFFIWCYNQGKTINRPFDKFPIEECLYGTPVYITLQERNQLFEADLSMRPQLAVQRDIFVFQTVVGCRVGDFYKLTKKNLVNGALEYIQEKTRNHNPRTVRVPLNDIAKTILERYKDYNGETLLPFISEQKYNQAIKEAFRLAGLNRVVTVLNPLTREPEQKYLYEVATTHTARRTFIGNMYKKVKDPDLVSSLSGHKEGSKAFRRYREIDDEMKQELVHLLD